MVEEFRAVPSYEGIYEVSNLGNIKSLQRIKLNKGKFPFYLKEKLLRLAKDKNGYYTVSLNKNNTRKTYKPHQLVAMAFLGHNPNGMKLVVDHIDNNSLNNRIDNLQIITQRENASKDQKNKTSNFTGVYWFKANKKWRAYIKIGLKQVHLGYFDNEEEASNAYQNKLKTI
jgi:hypothetical protein